MSLIHSHAQMARFDEPDLSSSALDEICCSVATAVETAYGPFNTITDYVDKIDNFLGKHAQYAEWREARSDAAADVDAIHMLLVEAEMAMCAVVQAMKGRGA
jgi:hypothetical protein